MAHRSGRDQGVDYRKAPACRHFTPSPSDRQIDTQDSIGKGRFYAVDPRTKLIGRCLICSTLGLDALAQFPQRQNAQEQTGLVRLR